MHRITVRLTENEWQFIYDKLVEISRDEDEKELHAPEKWDVESQAMSKILVRRFDIAAEDSHEFPF